MATQNNLTIDQGSDHDIIVKVYSDTAKTVPFDLTGYTASMMVRSSIDSSTPLLSMTSAGGKLTMGSGQVTAHFSASDTTGLKATKGSDTIEGVYDLEVTLTSSGVVTRISQGTVSFSREVTR